MSVVPIDVRDLVGHPGASREVAVDGELEGLAGELVRVPERVHADLLLESVVEGILVSGRIRGTWTLRCARCLTEFEGPFDVGVSELFVSEPDPEADDYLLDPEALIDPEQLLRDAIGVEMPFSPLCREDCRGLCEVCGGNRNLDECPGHDAVDPRFAALSDLTFPDER
ncbi:MAG TPA: YceD family protein [Actinomycetota bacterium]